MTTRERKDRTCRYNVLTSRSAALASHKEQRGSAAGPRRCGWRRGGHTPGWCGWRGSTLRGRWRWRPPGRRCGSGWRRRRRRGTSWRRRWFAARHVDDAGGLWVGRRAGLVGSGVVQVRRHQAGKGPVFDGRCAGLHLSLSWPYAADADQMSDSQCDRGGALLRTGGSHLLLAGGCDGCLVHVPHLSDRCLVCTRGRGREAEGRGRAQGMAEQPSTARLRRSALHGR